MTLPVSVNLGVEVDRVALGRVVRDQRDGQIGKSFRLGSIRCTVCGIITVQVQPRLSRWKLRLVRTFATIG